MRTAVHTSRSEFGPIGVPQPRGPEREDSGGSGRSCVCQPGLRRLVSGPHTETPGVRIWRFRPEIPSHSVRTRHDRRSVPCPCPDRAACPRREREESAARPPHDNHRPVPIRVQVSQESRSQPDRCLGQAARTRRPPLRSRTATWPSMPRPRKPDERRDAGTGCHAVAAHPDTRTSPDRSDPPVQRGRCRPLREALTVPVEDGGPVASRDSRTDRRLDSARRASGR